MDVFQKAVNKNFSEDDWSRTKSAKRFNRAKRKRAQRRANAIAMSDYR